MPRKKTDDENWKREKQEKKQERMSQKMMRNFLFHKNGDCFFRIRLLLSYSLFPSNNANLMRIDAIELTHILFVENRLVSQSVFFSIYVHRKSRRFKRQRKRATLLHTGFLGT